ncbi:MAG TPA: MFS transporter, partial [bacterium]
LVLSWGGHEFPWASLPVIGGATTAAVLTGLFIWRQRAAAEPLVPLGVLSQPIVRVTSLSLFLLMLSNISVGVYTPLYFELYAGQPASRAGLLLIGLVVCAVTGSYLSAQYMRRTGRYKPPPRIGLLVSAAGMLGIAGGLAHLPPVGIALLLGVVGFGMGLTIPMYTIATQNAVNFKDLGIATAGLSFFRALGGTLGVSLFGAVILALLPRAPGARVSLEEVAALAATSGQAEQVALAFRAFYGGCAVMILGAWVLVQFLPEIPLRTQVAHQAEAE